MIDSLEYQLGLYAATFAHALIVLPLLGVLYAIGETIFEERKKVNRRRFSFRRFFLWEVNFRKIGGIYFLKVGRFGCSFWASKRKK